MALLSIIAPGAGESSGSDSVDLSFQKAYLGASVALEVSDTWYDGPSLDLAAGKYIVGANATYRKGATTASSVAFRLCNEDASVIYISQQQYHTSVNGTSLSFAAFDVIELASPGAVKIQMLTSIGSAAAEMRNETTTGPSGNTATSIRAIRIGD